MLVDYYLCITIYSYVQPGPDLIKLRPGAYFFYEL